MGLIIGTAGHIDHGKTSLVKALTGEDTDRLKEEKERGISIDLGFASFELPDGSLAGIVDVPGHERFIRNMLAGVHGIDLVLFTVAADDGVMPQTEEHLDILHLLGVKRAVVVVTKTDLVTEARVAEVEDQIRTLVAGTSLESSPIVRWSFVTGEGVESIRTLVIETLNSTVKPAPAGFFRLPVDRVFSLQGHGLVVTGTATSGEISTGEHVRCLPGSNVFRVRSVQVHNRPVDVASAGQRIALNLTGPQTPPLSRGDVIASPQFTQSSDRFDVWLELRPAAKSGLKDRQRIRVHVGTAERMGYVILIDGRRQIGAGESACCQICLSDAVHVLHGDRFILRDETAQRTLGGGTVIVPWVGRHKKVDGDVVHTLERLRSGGVSEVLETLVAGHDDFAVPIEWLSQFLNIKPREIQASLAGVPSIHAIRLESECLYASSAKRRRVTDDLVATLRAFHLAQPLAPGMESENLRDRAPFAMTPRVFRAVLDSLEKDGTIVREGSVVRLPTHVVRLGGDDQALVDKIKALLAVNSLAPPELRELENQLGLDRAKVADLMRVMEKERSIVRVSADLYFLADVLDGVKRSILDEWPDDREITPAAFRDVAGTTRKYAIPLLEYFDRIGITERVGATRRLKTRCKTL